MNKIKELNEIQIVFDDCDELTLTAEDIDCCDIDKIFQCVDIHSFTVKTSNKKIVNKNTIAHYLYLQLNKNTNRNYLSYDLIPKNIFERLSERHDIREITLLYTNGTTDSFQIYWNVEDEIESRYQCNISYNDTLYILVLLEEDRNAIYQELSQLITKDSEI